MQKQVIQVENISPEDFKKEIVTDTVAMMKKELQDFSENFTPNYSPEFIDSKEAAKILGVTLPTIFDWRKRRIIIAYRIGNKIRFKKSEIENSLTKIEI